MFMTAFVLFMGVVCVVCWFAALPKQCGSISQKREKVSRPQDFFLKGCIRFFFLLKF